ncbi:cysteate synthase [Streptomyces sp. WMMB 322]|uniref:cysteate synthase n=1 Tax=Streptomyces sp. WMMB 322 TaxID=1286821 RepID=UPI0006E322D2|nr:cysteate synthase [Streptomyces sp. WMMB 322]SCK37855.1 cysteate synthase [Streptomyces sp. WMMB 322]
MNWCDVKNPEKRHYSLLCPLCGQRRADDGLMLSCARNHSPALLQTSYEEREFKPLTDVDGVFRYRSWLPVTRTFAGAGGTTVLRSERISRFLGLPRLWLAFNGYWPEKGCFLETCTFKELEAYAVLGRMPQESPVLVVASAGNTAAAFAAVCSRYARPCLLIIPDRGLGRLRLREALRPDVRLVVLEGADYADAIALAEAVANRPGFTLEGGVRNVGRRDGLATVMYRAVEETGELPEHYFQAVGSAAGAIASHEAAKRLREGTASRRTALPRLFLSQNAGFAPIHTAWQGRTGALTPHDGSHAFADELTNRCPPYEVHSGVRDSLTESAGEVLTVERASAMAATKVFWDLEQIDLEPAAAVAAASLFTAVNEGKVPRDSSVLLNVTGGGRARLSQDFALQQAEPHLRLKADGPRDESLDLIEGLFATPDAARPRKPPVQPTAPV